jgi:hypothetical protein
LRSAEQIRFGLLELPDPLGVAYRASALSSSFFTVLLSRAVTAMPRRLPVKSYAIAELCTATHAKAIQR